MGNLNNKQNCAPQGSWWQNFHWLQQALGVAQQNAIGWTWFKLKFNTIIEFVFFNLQICHLNTTAGSAFVPRFCGRIKPMTQALSAKLGLLQAGCNQLSPLERALSLSWIRARHQNTVISLTCFPQSTCCSNSAENWNHKPERRHITLQTFLSFKKFASWEISFFPHVEMTTSSSCLDFINIWAFFWSQCAVWADSVEILVCFIPDAYTSSSLLIHTDTQMNIHVYTDMLRK